MFDYDEPENKVRCLLTSLKNAIDSEHQDNARLIRDLKDEDERKTKRIIDLVWERNYWRDEYYSRLNEFIKTFGTIIVVVIICSILAAWIDYL